MNEEKEGKERKGREGWREERNDGGKNKMFRTRASGIRKAKQIRLKENDWTMSSAYWFTSGSEEQTVSFEKVGKHADQSSRRIGCKWKQRFTIGLYKSKVVSEIDITM